MSDSLKEALEIYHHQRHNDFPMATSLYKIVETVQQRDVFAFIQQIQKLSLIHQFQYFLSDLASIYIFRDINRDTVIYILQSYSNFQLLLDHSFKMPNHSLIHDNVGYEKIHANSLFKESEDNHSDKSLNFKFYNFFDRSEFDLFKIYQAKFSYTGIQNGYFDYLMTDVLEVINGKIVDDYLVFVKSNFCIELNYSNNTNRNSIISNNAGSGEINIEDTLGCYRTAYKLDKNTDMLVIPVNKITLYLSNIYDTALNLKIDPYDLMQIVYIHELSHFAVIWSVISQGKKRFEYYKMTAKKYNSITYHELYAQFITYKILKNNSRLLQTFITLNKEQDAIYQDWINFTHYSIERFLDEKVF